MGKSDKKLLLMQRESSLSIHFLLNRTKINYFIQKIITVHMLCCVEFFEFFFLFDTFGLSTKEPYTVMLCLSYIVIIDIGVGVSIGIIACAHLS